MRTRMIVTTPKFKRGETKTGECGYCFARRPLNKAGKLTRHDVEAADGRHHGVTCRGSYERPTPMPSRS